MWNRQNESEEDRIHCSVFQILVAEVPLEVETNLPPWTVLFGLLLRKCKSAKKKNVRQFSVAQLKGFVFVDGESFKMLVLYF
jgi:hypothetical protein